MDRGRYRALLIAPGLGCAGLLILAGSLPAQTPTASPAIPAPVTATATPWVQASSPSTPVPPAKPASATNRVDKEGRPNPSSPAAASPSREEIANAMARKREEELARVAPTPRVKLPRAEQQLSPEEREAYERNLTLWLALPPEERQALRGQATERIREETERAYASLGLNLNDDQREVFALRYRQERRRLERELQEKAAAERARRLPEMMDRLKREFPTSSATANLPKPTPKPAATPTPTATVTTASPSPSK